MQTQNTEKLQLVDKELTELQEKHNVKIVAQLVTTPTGIFPQLAMVDMDQPIEEVEAEVVTEDE